MEIVILLIGQICFLIRNIKGILSKNPYALLRGKINVNDHTNNLKGVIEFFDDKADGYFSGWGKKKEVVIKNKITVKIMSIKDEKEELVEEGDGNWTRYLRFGNQIYWKYTEETELFEEEELEDSLPSSSKRREEVNLIKEEKFAQADALIEKIEIVENKDMNHRKAFLKALKKKK